MLLPGRNARVTSGEYSFHNALPINGNKRGKWGNMSLRRMERPSVVRKNTRAGDTEEQMVEIERREEKVFGVGRLFEIVQECWKDNSSTPEQQDDTESGQGVFGMSIGRRPLP